MKFIKLTDYEGVKIAVNPDRLVMMLPSEYATTLVFEHHEIDVHESIGDIIDLIKEVE